MQRFLTDAELEREAQNLSSFNGVSGYPQGFDGITEYPAAYTGYGDPMLNFAGVGGSFANAGSEDRQFQITVTNATASAAKFYLAQGLNFLYNYVKNPTNNGLILDGAFDGLNGNDLTASGSPGTIASFHQYLQTNPIQLLGMKVTSTLSDAQVNKQITYGWDSPFINPGSRTIKPGNGIDQYVNKDKTVVISLKDVFLCDQTYLLYEINAGETVTFDFMFGAALNKGTALTKLAEIAAANINAIGANNVNAMNKATVANTAALTIAKPGTGVVAKPLIAPGTSMSPAVIRV